MRHLSEPGFKGFFGVKFGPSTFWLIKAFMSVPAHDERDHAFAKKFGLSIVPVIMPTEVWDFKKAAYTENVGTLVNSGPINGVSAAESIEAALRWLDGHQLGSRTASYHLRDWIFSRQHYWGEPIPMLFCKKDGWVLVPEKDLPVMLPEVEPGTPEEAGG